MREAAAPAHRVHAPDQAAEPLEGLGRFDGRITAAQPGAGRDPQGCVMRRVCAREPVIRRGRPAQQGGRIAGDLRTRRGVGAQRQGRRGEHRHLSPSEFADEAVLLQDLRVAPASGTVDLGRHRAAFLEHDLEHPVLVGVQLQQPAVATQAHRIQCVEHGLWSQVGEGGQGLSGVGHSASCGFWGGPDILTGFPEIGGEACPCWSGRALDGAIDPSASPRGHRTSGSEGLWVCRTAVLRRSWLQGATPSERPS